MTKNIALYLQADSAMASYDAYIFSHAGRPFDGGKADALAASAVAACEAASRDSSVNQFTRNHYCAEAKNFRSIL